MWDKYWQKTFFLVGVFLILFLWSWLPGFIAFLHFFSTRWSSTTPPNRRKHLQNPRKMYYRLCELLRNPENQLPIGCQSHVARDSWGMQSQLNDVKRYFGADIQRMLQEFEVRNVFRARLEELFGGTSIPCEKGYLTEKTGSRPCLFFLRWTKTTEKIFEELFHAFPNETPLF